MISSMGTRQGTSAVARLLTMVLVELLVFQSTPLPLRAQNAEPMKLNIVILDGEGAVNNIRQRVARESIVQVEDENHKPVAGAAVIFFLPEQGASGVFPNGTRSLTMVTDQSGKAVARGIRPNQISGDMQIRVNASFRGQTASTIIHQKNIAGAAVAGGAISGKLLALIIAGAAGAATAGAIVATRGGNGQPAVAPATTITPGTPTVGPPR